MSILAYSFLRDVHASWVRSPPRAHNLLFGTEYF